MANVSFVYATQAQYTGLQTKNPDALYFIYDTHKIYRGNTLITSTNVDFGTTAPTADNVPAGILYVYQDSDNKITVWANNGTSVVQVGGGEAESVADGSIKFSSFDQSIVATSVNENPSSEKIVTEKAVKDYVDGIKDSIQQTVDGTINNVTKGASSDEDPSKFGLIFTKVNGSTVTVDIEKEKYLQSAEVSEDGTKLILTVVTASGDPTVIEIPLNELVNVDASTVNTTQTITVTTPVGNYTKGQKIPVNNIQAILMNMLSTDSWPAVTNPSVSLSGTGTSAVELEVGSKITPTFSSTFSAGSYGQTANNDQVATGITPIVWTAKCTGQSDKTDGSSETPTELTTFTGTFDEISITDSTNASVSVSATYTAAANGPKTYLGNSELDGVTSDQKKIKAGTATRTGGSIKGFRNMFYGRSTSATALTGDQIYSLTKEKSAKKSVSVTAQVGDRQVVVAYPESLTSATPTFEYFTLSWGPFEGFVKSTVQVHGAVAGEDLVNYTVWTYTAEAPLSAATQFRVTIK